MIDTGAVRLLESPCASPVVLAQKKDGTAQLCVDCRKLNAITHGPSPTGSWVPVLPRLRQTCLTSSPWHGSKVPAADLKPGQPVSLPIYCKGSPPKASDGCSSPPSLSSRDLRGALLQGSRRRSWACQLVAPESPAPFSAATEAPAVPRALRSPQRCLDPPDVLQPVLLRGSCAQSLLYRCPDLLLVTVAAVAAWRGR